MIGQTTNQPTPRFLTRYSLGDYARMLADPGRVAAFAETIKNVVKPGDTVLEIGTGLGYFAALSVLAGASKVYAVEPNPITGFAKKLLKRWGVEDRVALLECSIADAPIDEKVDVILSDLHGSLPFLGPNLVTLRDSIPRYLKPSGRVIPMKDIVYAGAVASRNLWEECVSPWGDMDHELPLGMITRALLTQSQFRMTVRRDQLISDAQPCFSVNYTSLDNLEFLQEVTIPFTADGEFSGIALWFDTELAPGIGFSNHPGRAGSTYGMTYCPVPNPRSVRCGESIQIRVSASLVDGCHRVSVEGLA